MGKLSHNFKNILLTLQILLFRLSTTGHTLGERENTYAIHYFGIFTHPAQNSTASRL